MTMGIFNKVPLKFLAAIVLISSVLNLWRGTEGWSYHSSKTTMNWESARRWCRQYYTDMVAIQNKKEIDHLNDALPKVHGYYWIGIRKINGSWTWVGTNKTLTKEAENWAYKEPNNGGNNEDCVEIYIKREKDEGKWNDESCLKKKTALCYTASCKDNYCVRGQGECVETINSHYCSCFAGFNGTRCEHVIKCKPEDVTPPDHASVKCTHPYGNFSYDSKCEYSCEEGYELKGSSTRSCTSTTEWSGIPSTCELVQCPELIKPQKGHMQCQHPTGQFRYQSTCVFMCEEGYTLRDCSSSTLSCGAKGSWNDSQPTCEIIKCKPEDVTPPDHASVKCTHPYGNFSYDSKCEYSCEEGYELKGSSTRSCTSTTEWSGIPSTCELVQCPELIKPQKGHMQCQHPMGQFRYQSTCVFMCEEGYTLRDSSSSTLSCGAKGSWNDSQPTCEIIKCKPEDVTPPDHASVKCTHPYGNFSYNSKCEYSCEEGYELKGSSTRSCTSTTKWSGKPPTCELIHCPALESPVNGELSCTSSFNYGSKCSFSCTEGFNLQGASEISCTKAAKWGQEPPHCEAVLCPQLSEPINGHMNCSSEEPTFGTFCLFSCQEGHQLEDHSKKRVICNHNGSWSGEVAVCQAHPDPTALLQTTEVALGVSVATCASGLGVLLWILKRLRRKGKNFELNSTMDFDDPPQFYKNSVDSLI
ncbi:E-selectin-like isoform X3 [Puntigrus tetrazona]|uniref:E-selectin-like isoform X1 n=1 Tax=Puntigrus tetrazona TaxID=1606681 RepID=UPI001C8918B2|nr:E-selectin-like isoform X1 [Puntigrus tetrazona]XP_043075032.1 E-selectin-like isoform X3 [Puntigrus tetrazona]